MSAAEAAAWEMKTAVLGGGSGGGGGGGGVLPVAGTPAAAAMAAFTVPTGPTGTGPTGGSPDMPVLKDAVAGGVPARFADAVGVRDASAYVLSLIQRDEISAPEADAMMRETLDAWAAHVNPAFLTYRKSVADDFAACEWRDGRPGGCTLIDSRGQEYIDCLGGFGIFNVGRSHPTVVGAVQRQLAKQPLHSQELLDPLRAYAAALLAKTLPGDLRYAFFTNSGTESVEACLKFAMLATGRRHFVGVLGAFHGKTLGALAGTSKAVFRAPFGGGLLPFTHVPVNDVAALRAVFEASRFTGNEIAGFIVEPVLGEGGIHECSAEYLAAARALCDASGACLIFDEVQSGMGRTGTWWACEAAGVAPDLMAIGKGFGGGVMPAGAAVGTPRVWAKYLENPFLFTSTFGGNPLAMAAAIATMHVVDAEGLPARAAFLGTRLLTGLRSLRDTYPHIIDTVRGRGLMIGLQFHDNDTGYDFSRRAFASRVLLAGTLVNAKVIRVEPPLTLTDEEADTVLDRMAGVLADMHRAGAGNRAILTPATAAVADAAAAAAVGSTTVAAGGAGGAGAGAVQAEDAGVGAAAAAAAATAPATATATPSLAAAAGRDRTLSDAELPTADVAAAHAADGGESDASSLSSSSDEEAEPSRR